jgi:hypothetical protein
MKMLSWSRYHYRSWLSSCVVRRRKPRKAIALRIASAPNDTPTCVFEAFTSPGRIASSFTPEAVSQEWNMSKLAAAITEKAELKNFAKPDDIREFPNGRLELINIGGATIGRAVFEPGWRWATSVQPIAKTSSCEAPHFQYHVAGILRIRMDDGTEFDCRPGDVSLLPSGHDAWVVGNEPAIVVDFQGMLDYARGHHAA